MNFLATAALQFANFNPMRVLVLGLFCGFLLMAPDAHAKSYNEKLCPAEYPEHGLLSQQSPMCYQQCKPDYAGIGGVCVQVRASECLTQGNCVSTPSCKPGQENILGVCFNACPSTHNSSEVACTQKTPAGWSDAGAFFFRNTSKRVCTIFGCVNVPIYETRPKSILPRTTTGLASQCPAGQTLRLGLCVRNSLNAYVRGQVSSSAVAAIATDSFVKPVDGQPADEAFTVAVISDTQLPWDETSSQARAGKSTADSVLANSRAYNLNLVQSVNGLQNALQGGAAPLAFTVINGDLTAYFHPEQVSEFRAFYDKAFPWAYPHVLQSPVFLGLGNHDYENNLGSCLSFSWDKDRCAKNAINLIRGSVFAGYTNNMPAHTIESFDAGSLAYSWNRGRYHFVQLHNAPNYKIDRLKISASIEWLRTDLARAKARGQSIIINMHKPALPDEFLKAIDGHPVVAIFAGHLHSNIGKIKDAQTPSGQTVPVFLSGSADQQSFLQVGFDPNKVRVTPCPAKGGKPRLWEKPGCWRLLGDLWQAMHDGKPCMSFRPNCFGGFESGLHG